MNILIVLCSSVGMVISLYFALVYHGMVEPDARWIPRVCRMEKGTCDTILRTQDAKVLGVPNFYPGILFYSTILWAVISPDIAADTMDLIRTASGITVLLGIYLTYSLLRRVRVNCVFCFASHAINLILFILLMTI